MVCVDSPQVAKPSRYAAYSALGGSPRNCGPFIRIKLLTPWIFEGVNRETRDERPMQCDPSFGKSLDKAALLLMRHYHEDMPDWRCMASKMLGTIDVAANSGAKYLK